LVFIVDSLSNFIFTYKTPKITELEAKESLIELERLVNTLGFKVVGIESQRLPSTKGHTVVGEGKLQELVLLVQKTSATKIIFDCELTPSQVSNVQNTLGIQVLDRTGVIIEIFSSHAWTRAAQLQVEIARQNTWHHVLRILIPVKSTDLENAKEKLDLKLKNVKFAIA
jgi:GTP-binding protein HflX